MSAFVGDNILESQITSLVKLHGIKTVVETGTYGGETTAAFARMGVPLVLTIEKAICYYPNGQNVAKKYPNVKCFLGSSPDIIYRERSLLTSPVLFYLDAHSPHTPSPLINELQSIAKCNLKPFIILHDFVVPNTNLGFDTYEGQSYTLEWIKPWLDKIGRYKHFYNDPNTAKGARRGVLFINYL